MANHGDYNALGTVDFNFTSLSTGGSPFALANGTVNVYRTTSLSESAAGVTLTPDFDGRTGLNHVHIETGVDPVFYTPGNDYSVILIVGQIAGIAVDSYVLGDFSIGNRSPLRPTSAGRTLDVSASGEAGVDWNNIGAPSTTVNLSGTTVKAVTDALTVGTNTDKTGYALSSTGLDAVGAPADLANDAAGRASFVGMFRALFNRFYDEVRQTATTQTVRNDAATVHSTMAVSDDSVTQIKGKSS